MPANDNIHFSSKRNDWRTPRGLFGILSDRFAFVLDVAASPDNALCRHYLTAEQDALSVDWASGPWMGAAKSAGIVTPAAWGNIPFGDGKTAQWIDKAADAARQGLTCVLLVPVRFGTRWWDEGWTQADEVIYIDGRIRFELPDGRHDRAPFGAALLIFHAPVAYFARTVGLYRLTRLGSPHISVLRKLK